MNQEIEKLFVNKKNKSIFPYRSGRLFPTMPKVGVWTCSITDAPAAAAAGIRNVNLLWWETNLDSFWKLLLFDWFQNRSDVLFVWEQENHAVFSACSNNSNFLMNGEVWIRFFRFSSLKSPFKCVPVCVIGSGRSRGLGVGGHDDLASFSCFSWVLTPSLLAADSPSGVGERPAESLSLLSVPVGRSLGTFHWVYLQRESEKQEK